MFTFKMNNLSAKVAGKQIREQIFILRKCYWHVTEILLNKC